MLLFESAIGEVQIAQGISFQDALVHRSMLSMLNVQSHTLITSEYIFQLSHDFNELSLVVWKDVSACLLFDIRWMSLHHIVSGTSFVTVGLRPLTS